MIETGEIGDMNSWICIVKDEKDGSYKVKYTPTKSGIFRLHVLIEDKFKVALSPYKVTVDPAQPYLKNTQVIRISFNDEIYINTRNRL